MVLKVFATTLICTTLFSVSTLTAGTTSNTNTGDTSFKKDNPSLLYTTRDFFITLDSDCYSTSVCVDEFYLILTFNIGMNGSAEIKQIGFKDAELEFYSKNNSGKNYIKQTFKKYEYVSAEKGWNVKVVFYPDRPTPNTVTPVQKFEFNGVVKQNSISGTLTFYSTAGQTVVALN